MSGSNSHGTAPRRTTRRRPERRTIALRGSDDTITRMVTGIERPFRLYWSTELQVEPALNDSVRELPDELFPRARTWEWAWE